MSYNFWRIALTRKSEDSNPEPFRAVRRTVVVITWLIAFLYVVVLYAAVVLVDSSLRVALLDLVRSSLPFHGG